MTWQYTDSTNTVVFRINSDGGIESHLANVTQIQEWISEGNVPIPASQEQS